MIMQQKHLNAVGFLILVACFAGLLFYFTGEYQIEKARLEKYREMQYYRDSLEAEDLKLSIEMMKERY